jgi:hypothetical protein
LKELRLGMRDRIQNHFNGNWQAFYGKYLQQIKRIGGQEFQALCPFHEDTKPSFNFNNETGAYFCHGCNKKGAGFHFYARTHGLDDRRDFPKILKGIASDFGIPWEEQLRKLVKVYDYVDAEGKLVHQTLRYEPKDFKQRRPSEKGNWVWNLKDIQPVLYRLPEVLKAQEVIVVEGEKDCDNLAAIGFVATTCAMGAKKWRDHYNESLKGKDIILCPDNDNEGREHMTQVAISLNGNSKSLKWLTIPGLKSKGDVSDFIATFTDPQDAGERLAVMIQNAEPYEPPKKSSLENIIMTAQEFHALNLPERVTYLYPWLKEDSISLVSGWRGVGKTWFSWGIADAITRGQPFGPWKCEKPVPALILDGEMPTTDLQERIKVLGLDSDRPCPLYVYSDAFANQHGLPRAHLANESWRERVKSILLARHIKFWIVDNLASLAGGLDENSKKDWDPVNSWLLELRFGGIASLLLHHTNKEGGQRGTSAREDNIDCSILLKSPPDYTPDDGCRFITSFTKGRVSLAGLPLIADMEFKLQEEENGAYTWTWANIKKERKREILKMLDEGFEYDAICSSLSITKGYITKVKKQAVRDNLLTPGGKLSQSGFMFVSDQ